MAARPGLAAALDGLRTSPQYAGQIVLTHTTPPRRAQYGAPREPFAQPVGRWLAERGADRLYSHQAAAIDLLRGGCNVVVATGTASGKSLAYQVPILESVLADPLATALLVYPTKALTQDQWESLSRGLEAVGLADLVAGPYDGDTSQSARRRLREQARVILTNPEMLHVGLLPGHPRWSRFLESLRWLVLDEVHTYSGMFGSNLAHVMRRLFRVCAHYGSEPQVVACSATIANPLELTERLVGRTFALVDEDGSPRGERTTVFWNPPKVADSPWRSRRSANVEAQDLAVALLRAGLSTIVFSKAKMTAEMIRRYVCEALEAEGLGALASRVATYRGGYTPAERRSIEQRLFSGELVGVSTTPALELGIDVGSLAACVVVGYPGTVSSFLQQSGRAGRRGDGLAVLVGLDTPVNQYVMTHPDYILDRPVEQAVVEPENPFVLMEHLRCAAHELPIQEGEVEAYGPWARMVLRVLESEHRLRRIRGAWWHASPEVPQYEVSLRGFCDKNVIIEDADTHEAIGEMTKFDAQPLLHPGAIYMHQGETYLILALDLERNLATARRVDVDYYTQPLGGTDVDHIDHRIREKPLGRGTACWGEVTTYFRNHAFEKIRFYTLEAFAQEPLDLPAWVLETAALWLVPPEDLLDEVRKSGLNVHNGLRGIGYATRMLLPLFLTCETLDFSHTVGARNAPPQTVFIYERFPLGLGLTQRAYELLSRIMPRVLDHIRACPCADGCPLCVGKPLRGFTTWNVERGEAAIPSKTATVSILAGLLEGGCSDGEEGPPVAMPGDEALLEEILRRRLERARRPWLLHDITPESDLETGLPPLDG